MSGKLEAAVLQSWLTIGLIEAVVEKPVPESSLIKKTESGRCVMSLELLPGILQDWIDRILNNRAMEELTAWSERVQKMLTQAHSMMISLLGTSVFASKSIKEDDIPATICLIAKIGEALTNSKMAFPRSIPQKGFSWSIAWRASYSDTFLNEMVVNGWCPFTAEHLAGTMSITSLCYASTKRSLEIGRKHETCTTEQCISSMVDVKNYAPRHESLDCNCEHIQPSLDLVQGALVRKNVPVIAVASEKSENTSIRLTVQKLQRFPTLPSHTSGPMALVAQRRLVYLPARYEDSEPCHLNSHATGYSGLMDSVFRNLET
jgi:hypothetical protein